MGKQHRSTCRTWSLCTPSRPRRSIRSASGAGEAGAIAVSALFAQAIEDAVGLPDRGVELLEIPLSPRRLSELVSSRDGSSDSMPSFFKHAQSWYQDLTQATVA
jgi:hypothetical protein